MENGRGSCFWEAQVAEQKPWTSVQLDKDLWTAFKGLAWSQGLYATPLLDTVVREFLRRNGVAVADRAVPATHLGRPRLMMKV
jgi:hypothetical protein